MKCQTDPRQRPQNVRDRIIIIREGSYFNLNLKSEQVAEIEHVPFGPRHTRFSGQTIWVTRTGGHDACGRGDPLL